MVVDINDSRKRGILFHASEIAAVTGRNKYEKRWQAICRAWRRFSRGTFVSSGIILPDDEIDRLKSSNDEIGRLVEEAARTSPNDVEDLVSSVDDAAERHGLSKTEKSSLEKRLRKESFCAHGTAEEARTIPELRGFGDVTIDQSFVRKTLCFLEDGTEVAVGGRLDAFADSRVIEIKNRVGGLRFEIPDYEMTQVFVYMFVKEVRLASLVERLVFEDGTSMSCRHDVEWNQERWDEMKGELEEAARIISILSEDPGVSESLKNSRTKDAFLKKLANNCRV